MWVNATLVLFLTREHDLLAIFISISVPIHDVIDTT